MGRVIRAQRRGAPKGVKGRTSTTCRHGPAQLRKLDFAEREGYLRGVVTDVLHDPGRGAPVMKVRFKAVYHKAKEDEVIVAPEGVYSGQFLYFGKKATLAVGNVLPVGGLPEGTVICNVERYPGDRGKLAKASGEYCTIVGHNEDTGITKIRMPSGAKKNIAATCRCMVRCRGNRQLRVAFFASPPPMALWLTPAWRLAGAGCIAYTHCSCVLPVLGTPPATASSPLQIGLVAGGGRTEKPMLKAGRAFHKFAAKRNEWPKVRGVAMNPVDHPHGGGNHQHLGAAGTRSRYAPPGQKVGLIAARRTGRVRGRAADKVEVD